MKKEVKPPNKIFNSLSNIFFEAALKGQKEASLHIQDILSGKVPARALTLKERENYQLLGLIQLADCWPDSNSLISKQCKEAMIELFYTFPSRYNILPELVLLLVRKVILFWPKDKTFYWNDNSNLPLPIF